MKKLIAAGALAVLVTMGAGGTAFAGEVTGNGKGDANQGARRPLRNAPSPAWRMAKRIPTAPSGPGVTQNWGQIAKKVR